MLINLISEEKVKLRALTLEDAKITWRWRNEEEIQTFYSGHPFYVNIEKEEKWYESVITSDLPLCAFGIVEAKSDDLIGMTFLNHINLIHRSAEYSILIGKTNSRGMGYAFEATIRTLHFGFMSLNLNRIFLKVLESNLKAVRLYEKCRFQKEGILRESVFKNGSYINEFIMSILKVEYLKD